MSGRERTIDPRAHGWEEPDPGSSDPENHPGDQVGEPVDPEGESGEADQQREVQMSGLADR